LTRSDLLITCNTYYLNTAFNNQTYAYFFTIPPGLHGNDIPYTYYNGGGLQPVNASQGAWGLQNVTAALTLQDWIVTFARDGRPSAPDISEVPEFEMYGPDAHVVELNLTEISVVTDPAANDRCKWWQKGLYY
jgi:carboxylesterase type B